MNPLTHLTTALAGRYDLVREIGEGGMATVYLARDVKHDRDVAIKVLKPELGAVLGVERFLSEIKVTANLQHPNLLPLFDSGEAGGLLFYVMPFVEGETLRARLDREKQLPVDEAVRIATAIAGALAYAHERGVIHRDLKPENILLQAGQPVIADFGIALAVSKAGGARVTQTGLSLGTPQYMSPEQATGDRVIDARSDLYSLAAMTYEMLVGDPPHVASTAQAIVAKLLTERPASVQVARPAVGDAVAYAIDRGLEKLPADRWSGAAEFAEALRGRMSTGATRAYAKTSGAAGTATAGAPRWMRGALGGVSLLALAGVVAASWLATRSAPPQQPAAFTVVLPESVSVYSGAYNKLAISPDGSTLVIVGQRGAGGPTAFYRRRLADPVATLMAGTDSASRPAFSPNGQWLLFVQANKLVRMPVAGGTAQVVSDSVTVSTSGWGDGDVVVFGVEGANGSLYRATPTGGDLRLLARPDPARKMFRYRFPHVLPGGTHALVVLDGSTTGIVLDQLRLGVVSLTDGTIEELGIVGSNPQFVAPDRLVYGTPGKVVMTAPFSLRSRTVTGPSERVADGVWQGGGGAVGVAASRNGVLAIQSGANAVTSRTRDIVVVTEKGVERPTALPRRDWEEIRVSPDGKRVAGGILVSYSAVGTQRDVWISELQSGITERLTTDSLSSLPEWTRDGQAVAYSKGPGEVRLQSWPRNGGSTLISDKTGLAEFSPGTAGGYWAFTVPSPTGRLVERDIGPMRERDIWIARDDSLSTLRPFIATAGVDEVLPRVSPNGQLLAYGSNEDGKWNIYIQPISALGARVRVSVDGGGDPAWSPDGTALFYRTRGNPSIFMRATITDRPRLAVTRRDSLFPWVYGAFQHFVTYDVLPGGHEFLMLKQPQAEQRDAVTVITNWPSTLGRARAVAPAPVP